METSTYNDLNREQVLKRNAEWRATHPELMREYQQAYVERHPDRVAQAKLAYSETHRKEQVERTARNREQFPEKYAARKAVQIAVKQGKLTSVHLCRCAKCGSTAKHYHHWSYAPEHRLDVIPLCVPCHKATHAKVIE